MDAVPQSRHAERRWPGAVKGLVLVVLALYTAKTIVWTMRFIMSRHGKHRTAMPNGARRRHSGFQPGG